MVSHSTVYLISGANRPRGLGYAIAARILQTNENAFVYAGARCPDKAVALEELRSKYPGQVSIVQTIAGDTEGNASTAKEIEERHGCVDTVIACTGLANTFANVDEVSVSDMENHFRVNVMGPIILFQSVYALLKKSSSPRFVAIGSSGGCISGGFIEVPIGSVCYGTTKAALHWATRKIHFENDWLVAFPLDVGPVGTDMMDEIKDADKTGIFKKIVSGPQVTAAEVAGSIVKVIDESTREKEGGEFIRSDGTKLPYW